VLSGKLLCYNALSNQTSILKINRNNVVINEVLNEQSHFNERYLNINCETSKLVSIKHIINKTNIQIIDVRERHEEPKVDELPVTSIPLSSLQNNLELLSNNKDKYFFCQSGVRSKKAVEFLKAQKIMNCYSIEEGAQEIIKYLRGSKNLAG
jgi:adenylyltransferase/sulfurtransferase